MSVPCEVDTKDNNLLRVQIPVTRSDIMHECDLVEDVAIAYGYNNLALEVPKTNAGASEQPVNHLSHLMRQEMASAGFTECLNWALVSKKENFAMMRHEEKPEALRLPVARPHEFNTDLGAAHISNPKTKDFEIVRTSMLPGILKCLASNKEMRLPIKLFEVGDVVVREPSREVGCRNVRRVAAVFTSNTTQFALMHGVLDQIMYSLFFEPDHEHKEGSKRRTFRLIPSEDPSYFPGMQAHVECEGIVVGIIGELHPEVLSDKGFDIGLPTSALELNLEPFLDWI
jgi:phenylalanyl-tRNA synthetase beta chain